MPVPMIGKLEMFIALSHERHFGRAAESLGITQPTLSTGIRQLEDQLGVKLVQRGSRFGGLTPEGQRALVWARQIVGDTRRLKEEMRARREGLSGNLRLAVIPTALTWAADLAHAFQRRHPNVEFTILSRPSNEILTLLEDLEIDAGISYLDNEPLGRVTTRLLYRERYALLCPPDHPLADRETLDWAEIGDTQLCLLTPDMQNRRIVNRHLMEAGLAPRVATTSNSTVVLASLVASGGWATILPMGLAEFLAAGHGLRRIPVGPGDAGHAVGLVAAHQEPHTPVLQSLLAEARSLSEQDPDS